MSEYNCRVKRVVPKDHILRTYTPVKSYGNRDFYQEAAFQKGRSGKTYAIDLHFCRFGKRNHSTGEVEWTDWALLTHHSYISGELWPGKPDIIDQWYALGTALHHRPQDQT